MSTFTFHPFPNLPYELRLKVWEFALPGSLIIPFHTAIPHMRGNACLMKTHLFVPSQKVPSLFHVNSESRRLISPRYQTGFSVCQDLTPPLSPSYSPANLSDSDETETEEDYAEPERNRKKERKRALREIFFPCHHEAIIWNQHKEIYWNPERDIIRFSPLFQLDESKYTMNTACVWSFHGYKDLKVRGVKNLALDFGEFSQWIDLHPDHRIFCDVENIYVILTRLTRDEDDEMWEDHMAWFKQWFRQTLSSYDEWGDWRNSRETFNLRIVQSLEGDIEEGAWEGAVDVNLLDEEEDEYSSLAFEPSNLPDNEEDFHTKWTAAYR
jgi:2EXR family